MERWRSKRSEGPDSGHRELPQEPLAWKTAGERWYFLGEHYAKVEGEQRESGTANWFSEPWPFRRDLPDGSTFDARPVDVDNGLWEVHRLDADGASTGDVEKIIGQVFDCEGTPVVHQLSHHPAPRTAGGHNHLSGSRLAVAVLHRDGEYQTVYPGATIEEGWFTCGAFEVPAEVVDVRQVGASMWLQLAPHPGEPTRSAAVPAPLPPGVEFCSPAQAVGVGTVSVLSRHQE